MKQLFCILLFGFAEAYESASAPTLRTFWNHYRSAFAYRPHYDVLGIKDPHVLEQLNLLHDLSHIHMAVFHRMKQFVGSFHRQYPTQAGFLSACQQMFIPTVCLFEPNLPTPASQLKVLLWCKAAKESLADPSIVGFDSDIYLTDATITRIIIPTLELEGLPKVKPMNNYGFRKLPLPFVSESAIYSRNRQLTVYYREFPLPMTIRYMALSLPIGQLPDRSPSLATQSQIELIPPEIRIGVLDRLLERAQSSIDRYPVSYFHTATDEYLQHTATAAFMDINVFQLLARYKYKLLQAHEYHLTSASSIVNHLQLAYTDGRYYSLTPEYILDWFDNFSWLLGFARMTSSSPIVELSIEDWTKLLRTRRQRLIDTGYELVQ